MAGKGQCGVCEVPAQQTCGGCGSVYYCSREHQRKHWPTHRQDCQPYKLVASPEAGQYLIAGRQLKAGLCVLKDTPLVVGPLASSSPICLGCSSDITTEDFVKCPQCEWPMCSSECASNSLHKDECPILARDKKRIGTPKILDETPRYDIILAIRCLLLKLNNLPGWEVLLNMASHVEQRMIDKELHHMTTVYYLTQILKVDFELDTVHRVRGAIATNAMEIRSENGAKVRALYPRIRLLNHSCAPNITLTCTKNQVMEARTATAVEPGAPLHICYTATTMPLWDRQSNLHYSYYFTCACQRCSDPTELGTYFSCPRCPECSRLYMQPRIEKETIWTCPYCKYEQSTSKVQENVNTAILTLDEAFDGTSYNKVVSVLDQAEKTFHPTHYVWMKSAQLALYKTRCSNPPLEILKLRRDIWARLLALYKVFEPGLTRRIGMSVLETGAAILDAEVHELRKNETFSLHCKSQIELTIKYFQEAASILGVEHPDSLEATLSRKAEEKKEEAEDILARMSSGSYRADFPSSSEKTMGVLQECEMCGADDANVSCGECEQVYYCSTSHQDAHWDEHKEECQPTVIEQTDPRLGRFLVAGRDIAAGELLFKENPIALGPRAISRPVCLGCHKAIQDLEYVKCHKCSWPLCSKSCASAKLHEAECPVLAVDKGKIGLPSDLSETPCYDVILVLRCLLLRNSDPKAWNRLLHMASHAIHLANEGETHHMATILYIKDVLVAGFDPKFIHHARGAIMTNCFEWISPSNVSLRGVYPKTARINHSCIPNVALSSDRNGVMYARAAIDLKALSPLSITYTGSLVPIWERQAYLNKIHYFSCNCIRCHDPSEMGLHYSSPKCETCKQQYMEPKSWLGEMIWECPMCHLIHQDFLIKTEYVQWMSKFDCNDTFIMCYPKGIRNTLDRVEYAFHGSHHVWVIAAQVAIRTLQPIGTRDSLMLRRDIWKRLLKIYDILEPGMTRRRGMSLYELGVCLASLTRVEMKEGRLTDHFYKIYLKEALQYIENSIDILCLEPPDSHERRWYVKANQVAESVKRDLVAAEEKSNICSLEILDNCDSLEIVPLEINGTC